MRAKIIAGVITTVILTILIISGPANAFVMSLIVSDRTVNQGQDVNIEMQFDLLANEMIGAEYLQLNLDGSGTNDFLCKFDKNTTILEGCQGISISKSGDDIGDYGYGYGYQRKATYSITINTTTYLPGDYKTKASIKTTSGIKTKAGKNFRINGLLTGLEGCSIRAKNGIMISDNITFYNSKLNFYIGSKNAAQSQGYINAQQGRSYASYEFKIEKVVENDANHAVVSVSGMYKTDLKKKQAESALIEINKTSKTIDIVGTNVNAKYLLITFNQNCNF